MNTVSVDDLAVYTATWVAGLIATDDTLKAEDIALSDIRDINDNMIQKSRAFDCTDCRVGCASCCTLRPDAYQGEASRIVTLLKTFPSNIYEETVDRLAKNAKLEHLPISIYLKRKVRCAFLDIDTNACRIYEERPILCRDYSSTDVKKCKRAVGKPSYNIYPSAKAFNIQMHIVVALQRALLHLGVTPTVTPLHTAVLELL